MGLKSHIFPIRFQLGPIANGVLDCAISNAHEFAEMRLSSVEGDAVKDFLDAIIALLTHQDTFVLCHWYDEPSYYSWVMRHEQQELSIIICHNDSPIRITNPPLEVIQFQTRCYLGDFLSQVQGAYQQLVRDYGLAGYYKRWEKQFPTVEFEQLCNEIQHFNPQISLSHMTDPQIVSTWAFLRDKPQIPRTNNEHNLSLVDVDSIYAKNAEQLLRALSEPDRHDKKYLLSALSQRRYEITPELFDRIELSLIDDNSLSVIIRILGESADQRFLPYLEALLQKNPTYPVASNIVSSIEKLLTFETSYKLFDIFRYNDAKGFAYNLWRNVAHTIAEMGSTAIPMAIEALYSNHANIRAYAAQILGIIGDNDAYEHLLKKLHDTNLQVRVQVIRN